MRLLGHVISTAAVLCWTMVPTRAAAQTPEQEVLAFMITRYGRDAVVSDSAWGTPCERFRDGCTSGADVPADAWAEYVRLTRAPSLLRDVLPPDLEVTFESEHVEESSTPCGRRKNRLTLSRPGISADGDAAVVWWEEVVMTEHLLQCGAFRGGILLLRRNAQGRWVVDRPLQMFIS